MINWISTLEKMPEAYRDILFCVRNHGWLVGYYSNADSENVFRDPYEDNTYYVYSVTHWAYINMPGENEE